MYNEVELMAKDRVNELINCPIQDIPKGLALLELYKIYNAKTLDKFIIEGFAQAYVSPIPKKIRLFNLREHFFSFINRAILQALANKKIKMHPFSFHRGFWGEQQYYFITGMKKGKESDEKRHLVYHEPYGDSTNHSLFSVIFVTERKFMGETNPPSFMEISEVDIDDIQSLLSLLVFKNNTKIRNRNHNYYLDKTIDFECFKKEIREKFTPHKLPGRNLLDSRLNQYQFVIEGETY